MSIRFENYLRSGFAVHPGSVKVSAEQLYHSKEYETNRAKIRLVALACGINGSIESKNACQQALNEVRRLFEKSPDDLMAMQSFLEDGIRQINRKVYDAALRERNRSGYGASLALVAWGESGKNSINLFIAHVGCCRVILIRNDEATQLTTDQSWLQYQRGTVQYQQRSDALGQIEAHANRDEVTDYLGRREIVTLGRWREPDKAGRQYTLVNATAQSIELQKNDHIVVMTARPTDTISGDQFKAIVGKGGNQAARYLVDLTNKADGVHNAAVVLAWTADPGLVWKGVAKWGAIGVLIAALLVGGLLYLYQTGTPLPPPVEPLIATLSERVSIRLTSISTRLTPVPATAPPIITPVPPILPPTATVVATPTAIPSDTPVPATVTETPTATETPIPTVTFAAPPTATQTAVPTNTPIPPTGTNTPVSVDTPTPTQTGVSSTETSLPTGITAIGAIESLPKPFALSEINVKEGDTVNFNWQWSGGDLHDTQAFEVRVWAKGERNHGIHDAAQSKADSRITCEAGRCTFSTRIGKPAGEYLWAVAVVTIKPAYDDQNRNKYESSPAKLVVSSLSKPVEPPPTPGCDPNITNCNQ